MSGCETDRVDDENVDRAGAIGARADQSRETARVGPVEHAAIECREPIGRYEPVIEAPRMRALRQR